MWNYPDNETLEWTKNLKVRGKILGDGSSLTNIPGGTETDPIWTAASAALHGNVATVSGANNITSAAYMAHAGTANIHFTSNAIWNAIVGCSGAIGTKYSESSGALMYRAYQITSGGLVITSGGLLALSGAHSATSGAVNQLILNQGIISGANYVTSGAFMTHAGSGAIHFTSDAIWNSLAGKYSESSGALTYRNYQLTSAAYMNHAATANIHFTSDALWSAINGCSGAIGTKYSETSGARLYENYQSTSGGLSLLSGAYYGGGGGGGVNLWASDAVYIYPIINQSVSAAGLRVVGTLSGANAIMTGDVSGAYIYGDGSKLTGLVAGGGAQLWVSNATYIYPVIRTQIISGADIRISPNNTTLGKDAGKSLTAGGNTAIGHDALRRTAGGAWNTAVGSGALNNNSAGSSNTAVGYMALYSGASGTNTAIGAYALLSGAASVLDNVAVGYQTLNETLLTGNTGVGNRALQHNSRGNYNVAVGYDAGAHLADGSTGNVFSSGSIFLGFESRAKVLSGANEIVIGFNAVGAGTNTCVLGNSNLTAVNTAGIYSGAGFYTAGTISGAMIKAASGFTGSGIYTTWVISGGIVLSAS